METIQHEMILDGWTDNLEEEENTTQKQLEKDMLERKPFGDKKPKSNG